MSNQAPIVIAPRPLRSLLQIHPSDDTQSQRTEALDEFLSILTPAFLRSARTPGPAAAPEPQPAPAYPRWAFLSSPVSRTLTRNPFQRTLDARSPVPVHPATPAAVPLPSPTPDELALDPAATAAL